MEFCGFCGQYHGSAVFCRTKAVFFAERRYLRDTSLKRARVDPEPVVATNQGLAPLTVVNEQAIADVETGTGHAGLGVVINQDDEFEGNVEVEADVAAEDEEIVAGNEILDDDDEDDEDELERAERLTQGIVDGVISGFAPLQYQEKVRQYRAALSNARVLFKKNPMLVYALYQQHEAQISSGLAKTFTSVPPEVINPGFFTYISEIPPAPVQKPTFSGTSTSRSRLNIDALRGCIPRELYQQRKLVCCEVKWGPLTKYQIEGTVYWRDLAVIICSIVESLTLNQFAQLQTSYVEPDDPTKIYGLNSCDMLRKISKKVRSMGMMELPLVFWSDGLEVSSMRKVGVHLWRVTLAGLDMSCRMKADLGVQTLAIFGDCTVSRVETNGTRTVILEPAAELSSILNMLIFAEMATTVLQKCELKEMQHIGLVLRPPSLGGSEIRFYPFCLRWAADRPEACKISTILSKSDNCVCCSEGSRLPDGNESAVHERGTGSAYKNMVEDCIRKLGEPGKKNDAISQMARFGHRPVISVLERLKFGYFGDTWIHNPLSCISACPLHVLNLGILKEMIKVFIQGTVFDAQLRTRLSLDMSSWGVPESVLGKNTSGTGNLFFEAILYLTVSLRANMDRIHALGVTESALEKEFELLDCLSIMSLLIIERSLSQAQVLICSQSASRYCSLWKELCIKNNLSWNSCKLHSLCHLTNPNELKKWGMGVYAGGGVFEAGIPDKKLQFSRCTNKLPGYPLQLMQIGIERAILKEVIEANPVGTISDFAYNVNRRYVTVFCPTKEQQVLDEEFRVDFGVWNSVKSFLKLDVTIYEIHRPNVAVGEDKFITNVSPTNVKTRCSVFSVAEQVYVLDQIFQGSSGATDKICVIATPLILQNEWKSVSSYIFAGQQQQKEMFDARNTIMFPRKAILVNGKYYVFAREATHILVNGGGSRIAT